MVTGRAAAANARVFFALRTFLIQSVVSAPVESAVVSRRAYSGIATEPFSQCWTVLRVTPIARHACSCVKLKRAAELISFFGRVQQATPEKVLALIWPFIPPLVCELLTIVFLHLAFAVSVPLRRRPATNSCRKGFPRWFPCGNCCRKGFPCRRPATSRLCSRRFGISAGPPPTPNWRISWRSALARPLSGSEPAAVPSSKNGTGARCAYRYRSACTEGFDDREPGAGNGCWGFSLFSFISSACLMHDFSGIEYALLYASLSPQLREAHKPSYKPQLVHLAWDLSAASSAIRKQLQSRSCRRRHRAEYRRTSLRRPVRLRYRLPHRLRIGPHTDSSIDARIGTRIGTGTDASSGAARGIPTSHICEP